MISFLTIAGIIWGALLSGVSSRFAKFMPADPATAFVFCFHCPRFPKGKNIERRKEFWRLWKQILKGSFWGAVVVGAVSFLLANAPNPDFAPWFCIFVWIMALLAAIDARYHLLPDVLTIPLLLFGFAAAVFGEHIGVITSINGALFGYFVPMLAGVLMHKRHPRGIGGGDYKMLAALGAWLGVDGINLTIAFSFVIFALVSLVKRQRMGPYGPALTIGASLVLLMQIYYNYLPSSWLGLLKVF